MLPFYELQPTDITVIHNRRELYFHPHLHKEIEIVYVFKLGQHININDKKYEIKAGQAAIVFPDTVHHYYRDEWRPTDEVLVIASPKLFSSVFGNLTEAVSANPIITDIDDVAAHAFMMIASCTSPAEKLGWSIIILSRLLSVITLKRKEAMPVENLPQRIIEYIGANFKQDITLDTLAEEFSVSKHYISRIFSDKIKMNFRAYLLRIRAEYAASLIRSTNDSITNICMSSGFTSQRTFNRAFKEIYSMTPREYKNKLSIIIKD